MDTVILKNGRIHTFTADQPVVEAVVVKDGIIVDMGTDDEITLQWGRAHAQVIDLEGKTVSPGLTDSHMHLSGIGLQMLHLDLTGVASKASMLQQIREKAETLSGDQWLVGRGWDENVFTDGAIPGMEELDYASACPLFLTRSCGHAFLVNSKALEICGYHPGMTFPDGGKIELDSLTGKPTGLIHETAAQFIRDCIPALGYSQLKGCMKKAMREVLSRGLTSVHTEDLRYLGGFHQTYGIFDELVNQEQLRLRCNLLIYHPFLAELAENNLHTGGKKGNITIGAVKIFMDGSLGGRTALLSRPYSDDPGNCGLAVHDQEEFRKIVEQVRRCDMPVAVHAIGDKAVERVVQVMGKFQPVSYRDRLLHGQVLRPDLISELKELNLSVDIQPRFVASDYPWVEARLGTERMKNSYIWKTMIASGILCAGGSDAPVEPFDPILGIHAAVTRRKATEHHNGWNEWEKLSVEQAMRLFTVGGAYAATEEAVKGTIARGKYGDFTVYSDDIFEMDGDELLSVTVEKTIIGGQLLFDRG